MKFLVVGLGSMGKRRIRCLKASGIVEIEGFDPRAERREEAKSTYGVTVHADIDSALDAQPDAVVISTPPDLHMQYARLAIARGKHFFCEASVTDDGMDDVIAEVARLGLVGAPSCTMRFHPAVKIIKEQLVNGAAGDVLAFTAHTGQWLPDWHPWEDYRTYYVSKRATGACREIVPFELTWLTWLLGDFDKVAAMRAKVSDLDCDIDDVYQLILKSKKNVFGHLMVDVLARAPVRALRLICREGTIEWNANEKAVRLFSASTGEVISIKEPEPKVEKGYSHLSPEMMYTEEIGAFIKACNGAAPYPYTLVDDHRVLKLLYAAEQSSDAGLFKVVT